MDSITQGALGAVVADATLGSRIGKAAFAWGFLYGVLPDLDVVAYPWLDAIERLGWHRGISHSLAGIVLATPLLAWLVRRVHRRADPGWQPALRMVLLVLATHVLIDWFTIYGTGLLEPFSDRRFETGLLFIIDPLFSLPLLIATFAGPFVRTGGRARTLLVRGALVASTVYVAWACGAKAWANARFAEALAQQPRTVLDWHSNATPLNTLYWRCLARCDGGFLVGYLGLRDGPSDVAWEFVPRGRDLVAGIDPDARAFAAIRWFSQGWWIAREREGRLVLSDLRFGESTGGRVAAADGDGDVYVFNYVISADGEELLGRRRISFERPGDLLAWILRRGIGLEPPPER